MTRTIAKVGLAAMALILVFTDQRLIADTLYKKKAAVAIGFGSTSKSKIDWEDCSHGSKEKYKKPPYSMSKGDNCELRAAQFGLGVLGQLYVATDLKKLSPYLPDATLGNVVGFENDAGAGFILLTFGPRTLRLPYAAPPKQDQVIWNELSVAEGFANTNQVQQAKDLLDDPDQGLRTAPASSFSAAFDIDASVSLFRLKATSPGLSGISHSSLLQLAYLRSALEKEPEGRNPTAEPGCGGIGGEDFTITNAVVRFTLSSPCGFALVPGPDGKMPARVFIGNTLIQGGTHVLDGIAWDHDTFVGARIQYRGGSISLGRVRFVNCTFDVIDTPRGDQVIDLAISQVPHLEIGE